MLYKYANTVNSNKSQQRTYNCSYKNDNSMINEKLLIITQYNMKNSFRVSNFLALIVGQSSRNSSISGEEDVRATTIIGSYCEGSWKI